MGAHKEYALQRKIELASYVGTVENPPKETGLGYCIYMLSFHNGKQYIGLTTESVYDRMRKHRADSRRTDKSKSLIQRALIKYGFKNVSVTILQNEITCREHLKQEEQRFIAYYNTLRPNGYNSTEGGDLMPERTQEQLRSMGETLKTCRAKNYYAQYSRDGKLLAMYQRIEDLRIAHPEFVISHIYSVCNGYKRSAHGFLWRKFKYGVPVEQEIAPFTAEDASQNISRAAKSARTTKERQESMYISSQAWLKIPRQHYVLVMWLLLDGYKPKEVAEFFECSTETVKNVVRRMKLRDSLLNGSKFEEEE